MKSLLVKAVASAIALGSLVSCGVVEVRSSSPRLLTKSEVRSHYVKPGAKPTPTTSRPIFASRNATSQPVKVSPAKAWPNTGHRYNGLPAQVDMAVKIAAKGLPTDKHGKPTYSKESVRHRVVRTTAYSCKENEVGAYKNYSAAGTVLKYGHVRSAAADWSRYPVGTTFRIKGLPYVYVVDDYGSALVGTNTIDIYHPTLGGMNNWGTREAEINIIRWGSWERTANLLRGRTKYNHCAQMYYAAMRKINSGQVVLRREGGGPAL